jgi:hypothetical protein
MKKFVLLMLSMLVLMFSSARSVQAQSALGFPTELLEVNSENDSTPGETTGDQPDPSPKPAIEVKAVTANLVRSVAMKFPRSQPVAPRSPESVKPNVPLRENNRLVSLSPDDLFQGGSNSLVAKAVGSAEGTRTPDGAKTWAYYGHVDPGNGVWNLGSFSYQHGASSPENADVRQLNRLRRQFDVILQTAASNGLELGLEEQLNGIDLANQAPLAALDRGGYVDRLRQAYAEGLRGSEAVLRARTYAFLNPNTNRWDAPGLGNREDSISRDQLRRLSAIANAIAVHE